MVPAQGKFASDLHEHLDVEFITQQIERGVFNPEAIMEFVTQRMLQLCAPIRDKEIRAIASQTDIVEAFGAVMDVLDFMKLDLANFKLQQLKPHLKLQAVEYETAKMGEAITSGAMSLDKTREWLEVSAQNLLSVAAVRNPENIDIPENKIRFEEVYHDALLGLIFGNEIIGPDSLPETLILDAERIFGFQNEAQAITIVSALMMLSKNIVVDFARDDAGQKKLSDTLFLLMKEGDTTLQNIGLQIISSLQDSLKKYNKTMTESQEGMVHSMVEKTLSFKDVVYSMLSRRIQTHIKTQLTTGTFKKDQMARSGLELVQDSIMDLSRRILLLAKHNKEVSSKWLDPLIKESLAA